MWKGSMLTFGLGYDYKSIMHYEATAFGKYDARNQRRMITMIPRKVDNFSCLF